MNFISLQVDYWDSPWQNRHAFVWELSKRHPVFFLSPPFYLPELVSKKLPSRTRMPGGIKKIKDNLYSYIPPRYLPYNYRFQLLDKIIRKIRNMRINYLSKQKIGGKPILLIWHPRFADMIDEFDESFVVYYKYDNYSGYFGGSGEADEQEKALIKRADLMMVTSQGLYDMHENDSGNIHLVPNGVDYEFFSKTLQEPESSIPEDLRMIPGPKIGYVGVINEKVDFKLLSFLCEKHPDWSIVLVGPEKVVLDEYKEDLKKLKQYKNCYFLGQKNGRDVPGYIKGLDVAMMCYLVNDWTFFGYPLKMHEYLACGKPSVSADLPAVREFSDVVKIPSSYDEWEKNISEYLEQGDNENEISKRLNVAKVNSWAVRVDTMVELIQKTNI